MRTLNQIAAAIIATIAVSANAQTVSSASFAPISYGQVTSLYSDLPKQQNICAFGSLAGVRYSVLANGSGAGGAFTMYNGTTYLPYEVQWATSPNATSGTPVQPNVALNGQLESGALNGGGCVLAATATLITIVRATSLQQATWGNYSGTLTIILTTQ